MDVRARLVVCTLILAVLFWLIRSFSRHRINSGPTLFWSVMLLGGLVTALFPALAHAVSTLWGSLLPVSWISFMGILSLIVYLLYQSMKLKQQQAKLIDLARATALLERRLRLMGRERDPG